jgi:hypothetical protein
VFDAYHGTENRILGVLGFFFIYRFPPARCGRAVFLDDDFCSFPFGRAVFLENDFCSFCFPIAYSSTRTTRTKTAPTAPKKRPAWSLRDVGDVASGPTAVWNLLGTRNVHFTLRITCFVFCTCLLFDVPSILFLNFFAAMKWK